MSDATKAYGPYQEATVHQLLSQLPGAGMTITGGNPYGIDTHSHGVVLSATWDGRYVHVTITASPFYVSNNAVWSKLDELMPAADA